MGTKWGRERREQEGEEGGTTEVAPETVKKACRAMPQSWVNGAWRVIAHQLLRRQQLPSTRSGSAGLGPRALLEAHGEVSATWRLPYCYVVQACALVCGQGRQPVAQQDGGPCQSNGSTPARNKDFWRYSAGVIAPGAPTQVVDAARATLRGSLIERAPNTGATCRSTAPIAP